MQALEVRSCQSTQLMELQVNSDVGQGGYVSVHQSGPLERVPVMSVLGVG